MATGDKVVEIALAEVGVTEVPLGSNRGPRVQQYQAPTELGGTGWPWCAAFVEWVWEKAGGIDTNVCNPSTWTMHTRARAMGLLGSPRPGAALIWPGKHVEILVAPTATANVWHCVGGNVSDAVRRTVRDVSTGEVIVPKGLEASRPARRYFLEDVGARKQRRVYGPWRGDRGLEYARVIAVRARSQGLEAKVKRVGPGQRFATLVGPRVIYGPWSAPESRDKARRILEERLGRMLRPYSTGLNYVPGAAQAADLGKTT